jgi:hypothetical protein
MKDLVAYQIVNFLEKKGVEHIFGLCERDGRADRSTGT